MFRHIPSGSLPPSALGKQKLKQNAGKEKQLAESSYRCYGIMGGKRDWNGLVVPRPKVRANFIWISYPSVFNKQGMHRLSSDSWLFKCTSLLIFHRARIL